MLKKFLRQYESLDIDQLTFLRFHLISVAVLVACCIFLRADCLAQPKHQPTSRAEAYLKRFLRDYVGNPGSGDDKTTRYFSAFVDLKDDGTREVVVYLASDGWCGSGGCTTLILAPKDSSYKVITKITITQPPIRVLTSRSNGWHDIGVWVQGGGIQPGYEADLPFDGKSYPRNPSTPPARRLIGKVPGEVVVPVEVEGTPLVSVTPN
jgi:hypothetical protein